MCVVFYLREGILLLANLFFHAMKIFCIFNSWGWLGLLGLARSSFYIVRLAFKQFAKSRMPSLK